MSDSAVLRTETLEFEIESSSGHWTLRDRASNGRLLIGTSTVFFCPVLNDDSVYCTLDRIIQPDVQTIELLYQSTQLAHFRVILQVNSQHDAIDIQCSYQVLQNTQINRLELIPSGTMINLYQIVNFRNRHGIATPWPELPLIADKCETDTYSRDWQFAPHPTAMVFSKGDLHLFFGATDLPQAYGMYIKVSNGVTRHWYLGLGAAPNGLVLAARDNYTSPVFRLFVRKEESPYDTYAAFGQMLIKDQKIPDPALRQRHSWWREPLYCTWVDQTFMARTEIPQELQAQNAVISNHPRLCLTEKLVRDAVAVIQRERLPFRTILLDEGWNVARGDWQPAADRFPNFRGLVDDLHAQGFKVVIWWSWAEIAPEVKVDPAFLINGGKLNVHGCRMWDYSNPTTQNDYLRPLFKKLFSSDAGCYNLDGIKTDFLADKVHADMPVYDPAWRGEENYFFHLTQLYYQEMKRHKPDAVHIGCAGHYWLSEFIDINRTYDVFTSNAMEHESRARMLMATCPGCPVTYDFHNDVENLETWFASAAKLNASVQVGNVLSTRQDRHATPSPAANTYYALLRQYLTNNLNDIGSTKT